MTPRVCGGRFATCRRWAGALLIVLLLAAGGCGGAREDVRIGAKSFAESGILARIARCLAEASGVDAPPVRTMHGTLLLWEALRGGQIDLYPEYTGTLTNEILSGEGLRTVDELRAHLATLGLRMTSPLGFNNTYALGMREEDAARLGVERISDLRGHPGLRLRFSNEFMERADGWRPLKAAYGLPHEDVRGIEHGLAYEALVGGTIDVTDLYATDAKIGRFNLRVLEDDRGNFPTYEAIYVYRAELAERAPGLVAALEALGGTISAERMIALNAEVELERRDPLDVAVEYVRDELEIASLLRSVHWTERVWRHTREHLFLVGVSLTLAVLTAIPAGVLAARVPATAQPILAAAGIIQTIPSIALLVLLIRPMSVFTDELGAPQAIVALFLYSLLPIVRNTHAGLVSTPPALRESAIALGLPAGYRLWKIELPLAARTILAGVKTAAVINVGFATLGGFIGAGGYGQPIFTGITLHDYDLILQGALPAAGLAIAVQLLFELVERAVVPRGLRLSSET